MNWASWLLLALISVLATLVVANEIRLWWRRRQGVREVCKRLGLEERLPKKRTKELLPLPNGQSIEVDPNDPHDSMRDPAVRAMIAKVFETGRPMVMNRGEKPRFLDKEPEKKPSPEKKRS